MTDDEKRLVREAADRMFQATRRSHDDVAWEYALRPMLDEMARLKARPVLTEERAREMALALVKQHRYGDDLRQIDRIADALLRVSRGDSD